MDADGGSCNRLAGQGKDERKECGISGSLEAEASVATVSSCRTAVVAPRTKTGIK